MIVEAAGVQVLFSVEVASCTRCTLGLCHVVHFFQGMTKLPDFKKIEFPSVPPIPMEEVVPEAAPEVSRYSLEQLSVYF